VLDEVMTGFRVSRAGHYGLEGVAPTCSPSARSWAAGCPPRRSAAGRRHVPPRAAGPVYQAGTLSGNPLAVAAGRATLEHCTDEVYERVDAAAETVGRLASEALTSAGVPHRVNRAGSLFSIFFADHAVVDYATASQQNVVAYKAFFHEMLSRGVYLPPSAYESWFVSAAHDDTALERVAEALPHAARAAAAVDAPELVAPPTAKDST
jgi:glutamate-1-semialdehyde 2,1-aminomutase